VADLKGKVGRRPRKGTVDHYLLLLVLKQAGLSADEHHLRSLRNRCAPGRRLFCGLLQSGCGGPCLPPHAPRPSSAAGKHSLVLFRDFPGADSAITCSAGPNSWRKNPSKLQNVVKRLVRHPQLRIKGTA